MGKAKFRSKHRNKRVGFAGKQFRRSKATKETVSEPETLSLLDCKMSGSEKKIESSVDFPAQEQNNNMSTGYRLMHPPSLNEAIRNLQKCKTEHPDMFEGAGSENTKLADNMNRLTITALDPPIEIKPKDGGQERSKPLSREKVERPEFGFLEPETLPDGRLTLRGALQFIGHHSEDPATYSAQRLAQERKIPEEEVVSLLKHFKTLHVYIPGEGEGVDRTPMGLIKDSAKRFLDTGRSPSRSGQ